MIGESETNSNHLLEELGVDFFLLEKELIEINPKLEIVEVEVDKI